MQIGAAKFRADCSKLLRDVEETHEEVVITRFGKPVAKLVPIEATRHQPVFGFMRGRATLTGDIVRPTGERWDVCKKRVNSAHRAVLRGR